MNPARTEPAALAAILRQSLQMAPPVERAEIVHLVHLALRDHAPDELRAEEALARAVPEPAERFDR